MELHGTKECTSEGKEFELGGVAHGFVANSGSYWLKRKTFKSHRLHYTSLQENLYYAIQIDVLIRI